MEEEAVIVQVSNRVMVIALNRPNSRNAASDRLDLEGAIRMQPR